MRFFTTSRVKSEQLLLKRCHEDDHESLKRFATRSYKSEVERTVRLTLQRSYTAPETQDVAILCITHIYSQWRTMPSPLYDLHRRVRDAARKFAHDFIRADLES
jgi:hypothetical protein